jgi:DNA-binding response OmpR family regulator
MSDKPRVLLIEDEPGLVMTLGDRLDSEGYYCRPATDGLEGYKLAAAGGWDAILLDVMLPGKSGFDVCRDLRAAGVRTPILMLTARGQIIDRVLGLKLGADDYLCKPFDMSELLARLEALLRRAAEPPPAEGAANGHAWDRAAERGRVDYGSFAVDFARGVIERGGAVQALSGQEFKLLCYLTEHPQEVISRDRLLDAVWGYGSEVTTRTVDVHIAWLRKKIGDAEPLPRHIATIRGLGYKFTP